MRRTHSLKRREPMPGNAQTPPDLNVPIASLEDPLQPLRRGTVPPPLSLDNPDDIDLILKQEGYTPELKLRRLCDFAKKGTPAQALAAIDRIDEMLSQAKAKRSTRGLAGPPKISPPIGLGLPDTTERAIDPAIREMDLSGQPLDDTIQQLDGVLKGYQDEPGTRSAIASAIPDEAAVPPKEPDGTGDDDYFTVDPGASSIHRPPTRDSGQI